MLVVEPLPPLDWIFASQSAVVPPLLPAQNQNHGPLPITAEAGPELQSPLVGALTRVWPLDGPHAPFTFAGWASAEVVQQMALPNIVRPNSKEEDDLRSLDIINTSIPDIDWVAVPRV
jgi:hypothetical protein